MWKIIFRTTLFAGSLDILAAFGQAYLSNGTSPDIVLKYIASGALGSSAFAAGTGMLFIGLLFHFVIVFACVSIFFLLYPRLRFLHHRILLNSFVIAIVAWGVTTQLIIPLSKIAISPFHPGKALLALAILFFFIGIPTATAAKKFFLKKT